MYSLFCIGIMFVTCGFIQLNTADAKKGLVEDREALWQSLFRDYNKDIAPDGADGGPVTVKHSITILNLLAWENDILSLNLWEQISWSDLRLKWNPEMFDGVTELIVPSRRLWQPDILLVNSVDGYHGFATGDLNAVVRNEGSVLLVPPRIIKSSCTLNDSLLQEKKEITCALKYMSWTRSDQDMDLQLQNDPQILYNPNRRWNMTKITAERHEKKYECCPDKYLDIEYTLNLRRK